MLRTGEGGAVAGIGDVVSELTLYDLFGYLLPGIPTLTALAVAGWSLVEPASNPPINAPSGVFLAVLVIGCYLMGHLAQALGNATLDHLRPWQPPAPVHALVAERAGILIGGPAGGEEKWLRFVRHQQGVTRPHPYREIYTQRQGFYRGMTVGVAALAASAFLRAIFEQTAEVRWQGRPFAIPDRVLVFVGASLLVAAVLYYLRFRKFSRLRLEASIGEILTGSGGG